ncbi:MAG: YlxR family protein [Oscillospiraceae bacterium]|nr:YlxR family protein [Oscillospiraceae bacterium]
MAVKKVPMRSCCGCREKRPKRELIRVVRSPEGEVSFDITGRKAGRGVYLCNDKACLLKAIKSRALARALECEIPEEVYERLEGEMEKDE